MEEAGVAVVAVGGDVAVASGEAEAEGKLWAATSNVGLHCARSRMEGVGREIPWVRTPCSWLVLVDCCQQRFHCGHLDRKYDRRRKWNGDVDSRRAILATVRWTRGPKRDIPREAISASSRARAFFMDLTEKLRRELCTLVTRLMDQQWLAHEHGTRKPPCH